MANAHDESSVSILLVGAGALGGELVALLPEIVASLQRKLRSPYQSGHFLRLTVVDHDTVEESNLGRESILSPKDIGAFKAAVLASWLETTISSASLKVSYHTCRVEELPYDSLMENEIFICAADNLLCRRYVNGLAVSVAAKREGIHKSEKENLEDRPGVFLVEGGTEGLSGHSRIVIPGMTACIECTLGLYRDASKEGFHPPPLCSVPGRPSRPEHCIAWAAAQDPVDKRDLLRLAIQRAELFEINTDEVRNMISSLYDSESTLPFIPVMATTTIATAGSMARFLEAALLQYYPELHENSSSLHTMVSKSFWTYSCEIPGKPFCNSIGIDPTSDCPICSAVRR
jgi:molybdopterin/thiamine biosynthesis adenylyltransferase